MKSSKLVTEYQLYAEVNSSKKAMIQGTPVLMKRASRPYPWRRDVLDDRCLAGPTDFPRKLAAGATETEVSV